MSMIEALQASKCKLVKDILYMPTAPAKYISPLDNPLWHGFKDAIRRQYPVTMGHGKSSIVTFKNFLIIIGAREKECI